MGSAWRHGSVAGAGLLVLAGGAVSAASGGNVALALLPAAAATGAWCAWRLPLRITFPPLLFASLVLDNPAERPQQGNWESFLHAPGEALYANLHHLVGIPALRFSLFELLVVLLAAGAAQRAWTGRPVDGPGGAWAARPLLQALVAVDATLLLAAAWGWARGGDMVQALWQARQLGWLPLLAALSAMAFREPVDRRRLAVVAVAAALVRGAVGTWYYYVVCPARGLAPDYVTTHGDSMLFATAFALPLLALLERPSAAAFARAALVVPPVGLALVLNNRRLAFVSLLASGVVALFSLRPALRRGLARLGLAALPLVAVYVAAGWNSTAKIFAPLTRLRSAADSGNASNLTRDIENGNLVLTFSGSPLVGQGLGHEYVEAVHAFDLARIFPQYRYIAHNSVLWTWSVFGWAGFTVLWTPFVMGVFLSARSYRRARSAAERVAATASTTAIVCWFGQAYGDMGLQGWTGTLVVAAALGVAGRLAVVTGAWPEGRDMPWIRPGRA
jgi:hypothetical protein